MTLTLKVPTHLDGRNPIVGRYTAREVVPVVAGVFAAAGIMAQPHFAPALRVVEAALVGLLGAIIGLIRPGGSDQRLPEGRGAGHREGTEPDAWAASLPRPSGSRSRRSASSHWRISGRPIRRPGGPPRRRRSAEPRRG